MQLINCYHVKLLLARWWISCQWTNLERMNFDPSSNSADLWLEHLCNLTVLLVSLVNDFCSNIHLNSGCKFGAVKVKWINYFFLIHFITQFNFNLDSSGEMKFHKISPPLFSALWQVSFGSLTLWSPGPSINHNPGKGKNVEIVNDRTTSKLNWIEWEDLKEPFFWLKNF